MIVELIFELLCLPLVMILKLIPTLVFDFPADLSIQIRNIFLMAKEFLPWSSVIGVFTLSFTITNWRIGWNTIQRVWDALPFT